MPPPSVSGVDRRQFLVTKLSAGFAMAVLPISARTITTDTEGLEPGEVRPDPRVPRDFEIRQIVSRRAGCARDIRRARIYQGHVPALRQARILSDCAGIVCRQGDVSKITDIQQNHHQVVSKVPYEQVMSDLDAAVDWSGKSAKGDTCRLAITGFCWDGRIVALCRAQPEAQSGHGVVRAPVGQTGQLQPKHPIDVAGSLKAPVLGLYGGKDQGIPLDTIEQMRAALKAAGNPSEIHVYPNGGHGCNADYRPGYDKEAAQDGGWQRLQQWFKKYGVA
jgi:carboxymethylenebutenolidase